MKSILLTASAGSQFVPVSRKLSENTDLFTRYIASGHKSKSEQIPDPLGILSIVLVPFDSLHPFGVGDGDVDLVFKQGYQRPIDRFTDEMKDALLEKLNNDKSKFEGRCLVVVPSHKEGGWSQALQKMAKKLCQELNMTDCSQALERVKEHEKLAMGGDRSIESHMSTMRVNPEYDIKGKKVIVLDDVTTSGNSLLASARILKEAGAERVAAIAIGKTTEGTLPSAF